MQIEMKMILRKGVSHSTLQTVFLVKVFLKIGPLEENFCYIVKALIVKIKGLQQTPDC